MLQGGESLARQANGSSAAEEELVRAGLALEILQEIREAATRTNLMHVLLVSIGPLTIPQRRWRRGHVAHNVSTPIGPRGTLLALCDAARRNETYLRTFSTIGDVGRLEPTNVSLQPEPHRPPARDDARALPALDVDVGDLSVVGPPPPPPPPLRAALHGAGGAAWRASAAARMRGRHRQRREAARALQALMAGSPGTLGVERAAVRS